MATANPLKQLNDLIYTLHTEMTVRGDIDKLKINSALMQMQRAFITLEKAYKEADQGLEHEPIHH